MAEKLNVKNAKVKFVKNVTKYGMRVNVKLSLICPNKMGFR